MARKYVQNHWIEDHFHPNANGQSRIAEFVCVYLGTLLSEFSTTNQENQHISRLHKGHMTSLLLSKQREDELLETPTTWLDFEESDHIESITEGSDLNHWRYLSEGAKRKKGWVGMLEMNSSSSAEISPSIGFNVIIGRSGNLRIAYLVSYNPTMSVSNVTITCDRLNLNQSMYPSNTSGVLNTSNTFLTILADTEFSHSNHSVTSSVLFDGYHDAPFSIQRAKTLHISPEKKCIVSFKLLPTSRRSKGSMMVALPDQINRTSVSKFKILSIRGS